MLPLLRSSRYARRQGGALIAYQSQMRLLFSSIPFAPRPTKAVSVCSSPPGGVTTNLSTEVNAAGSSALSTTGTAGPVKLTKAQRKRSTLANVQQKPLLPGMFRHVTKFEGEHVYDYGKHTYALFRESSGLAVLPGGCLLAYVFSWFFGWSPVTSLSLRLGYLGVLMVASRVVSRGRVNRLKKDLTGRTAVVTGGTGGIGRETAMQLAKLGANVVLLAPDNAAHVEPALAYVRKHMKYKETPPRPQAAAGSSAASADAASTSPASAVHQPLQSIQFCAIDLSDLIAVRDLCRKWRREGKAIDILVNCAGVLQKDHVTTRFSDDVQLAVNVLGPFLLTEGLLPLVEAAHGRIVYVSCSAHVGVKGNIVNTYLTGRGVWSPRVAGKFDGLEQYGFTKLANIYHAQELAVRSYPVPAKQRLAQRLIMQNDAKLKPAADNRSAAEIAMENRIEPRFTTCACTPGGVMTNIYRHVPFAGVLKYLRYALLLIMRTPWEGSQTVVNCCLRDELKNGGYYMNTRYQPAGLSEAACSVQERQQVMAWTHKKVQPYMRWDG